MQMGCLLRGGQPAASWTINCFIETWADRGSERHSFTKEEASSLCWQPCAPGPTHPHPHRAPLTHRHPGFETSFAESDIHLVYSSCHEYGEVIVQKLMAWVIYTPEYSLQQLMGSSRVQDKLWNRAGDLFSPWGQPSFQRSRLSLTFLFRNKFYIPPTTSPCLCMWHSTCLNAETCWGFSFWSLANDFPPTFIHSQRWIFVLQGVSDHFKASF